MVLGEVTEMPDEKENYNYEPFADTEDYKKVNGDIITSWVQILVDRGTEEIDKLLDIATGGGNYGTAICFSSPDKVETVTRNVPGPVFRSIKTGTVQT